MNKYPIYIVSKGRWESRLTSKTLDSMGVPYKIIVEANQLEMYAAEVGEDKCLVLPSEYLKNYDTCDDLGDSKPKGSGAARNFAWDHAIDLGADRHWVMDDNIQHFYRYNQSIISYCDSSKIFDAMEDFADRYKNVYLSGPNYEKFVIAGRDLVPAFKKNTRIYSCLLIQNDAPYRWRGRYNEDVDLSLRVLKDGHCTVQYNAFLQGKVTTQRMTGGNTEELYGNGTKQKSQMIEDLHPDIAKVVWKFNRWHHDVNYRTFKRNKLKYVSDFEMPVGVNNYGMILKQRREIKNER